ncbi:MAG: hypothetical protein PHS44_05535 [Candidatus Dojkabacteria bacterium]|nr:hypothetical protein [Candidatus Dojkabacteria bacterium]
MIQCFKWRLNLEQQSYLESEPANAGFRLLVPYKPPTTHGRLEETTAPYCDHYSCFFGQFAALIQVVNIHLIKSGDKPIQTKQEIIDIARSHNSLPLEEINSDVTDTILESGTDLQTLQVGDEIRLVLPFGTKYKAGGYQIECYGTYQRYIDEFGYIYSMLPDGTLGATGQNCYEYFDKLLKRKAYQEL